MTTRTVGGVHWPELDGLRAMAILLVVARHSIRPFLPEDQYVPVLTLGSVDLTPVFLNGWIGVDLFFVLSGFLIGRQAWRRDGLLLFWFKRVTRILPAYWTCLAVVAVAITIGGRWSHSANDFFAHTVMLQDYTGSVFVPAFWSLGAEEKFYLLAPVFVIVIARCGQRWSQALLLATLWTLPIAMRAAAVGAVGTSMTYVEYFQRFRSPFHVTCESLVLGFTIAWLSMNTRDRSLTHSRRVREALFWTGSCVVLWRLLPSDILATLSSRTIVVAPAVIGIGFGLMVVAVVSGGGSYSRALGWKGWRPIATGSYTLYLTHMMIIPVAAALAEASFPAATSTPGRWIAFLPWYVALASASAYALHRLVERPVLEWRDRWLQSRRMPAPARLARAVS